MDLRTPPCCATPGPLAIAATALTLGVPRTRATMLPQLAMVFSRCVRLAMSASLTLPGTVSGAWFAMSAGRSTTCAWVDSVRSMMLACRPLTMAVM